MKEAKWVEKTRGNKKLLHENTEESNELQGKQRKKGETGEKYESKEIKKKSPIAQGQCSS